MSIITGNEELDRRLEDWKSWNKDSGGQKEVETLIASNNVAKLESMFLERIQFGTAGLRGRMGPGFSQMNDLVIIQTAQGLVEYLKKTHQGSTFSVVVGYDGRYNSKRWAQISSSIFLRAGARVYLFSDVCPTPFVPFGVNKYAAAAGVMVTASHNPKEDNGYKVYWDNGAQIIPPHDKGISNSIDENLVPEEESWKIISDSDMLVDPLEELTEDYLSKLSSNLVKSSMNSLVPVSLTYTAMHGVGYPFIVKAFKMAALKEPIPVVEQITPDPDFPTVVFPNPEEGKSALDLAIKTADANGSPIILANDPDADRLAIAEKAEDGAWKVFTGNEIGALLCWWLIHAFKMRHPSRSYWNNFTMSSTVSSKIVRTISVTEGLSFEETLTGFKWMGNRAHALRNSGKQVLFAFEEAIGFMCRDTVLDKDGVSAAVHAGELIAFLYSRKETLAGRLKRIYEEYGQHLSKNSYFICHDPVTIKSIFHRLNHFNGGDENTFPEHILDGKYKIIAVRDLHTGYDSTKADSKATLPTSKSSYMVTFTFENGLVATLRTSGTEPKLKYYTELCSSPVNTTQMFALMSSAISSRSGCRTHLSLVKRREAGGGPRQPPPVSPSLDVGRSVYHRPFGSRRAENLRISSHRLENFLQNFRKNEALYCLRGIYELSVEESHIRAACTSAFIGLGCIR
ncbi:unnamed protein product, partial [Nesidiocoris tenuis]